MVNEMARLKDFLKNIQAENTYVAHCNEKLERISIQKIEIQNEITVLIGPEGDFSDKEIQMLSDLNIKALTLGKQRLRTETAGIYVAAYIYSLMR